MSTDKKLERALVFIHSAALKLRTRDHTDAAGQQVENIIASCKDKKPATVVIMPSVVIKADPEVEMAFARLARM